MYTNDKLSIHFNQIFNILRVMMLQNDVYETSIFSEDHLLSRLSSMLELSYVCQ